MSESLREIGTLIVVILKARNLPNKRHIGKQDPYCTVDFNGDSRRTKAIKRGGQHPEWDEEIRFTLHEAQPNSTSGPNAPPPPPKKADERDIPSIQGGTQLNLACWAEYLRDPEFIGDTKVDLTEVLTKGETDEWFVLHNKGKYCGEVYLELTFWSNEPPPAKKSSAKTKPKHHYGGPGSFVPSDAPSSTPSTPPHASVTPPRDYDTQSNGSYASPSKAQGYSPDSVPSSLRSSTSMLKTALYSAPYETMRSQSTNYQSAESLANDFAELGVQDGVHRRPSHISPSNSYTYPPPSNTQYPQHASATYADTQPAYYDYETPASYSETSYSETSYSEDPAGYEYDRSVSPGPSQSGDSVSVPPAPYQAPYESSSSTLDRHATRSRGPRHSFPASSSGFVPIPTPAPSGFTSFSQQPVGYAAPMQTGYDQPLPSQHPGPVASPAPLSQMYGHPSVHPPAPPPSAPPQSNLQSYSSTFAIAAAPYVYTSTYYPQYAPPPGPPPAPAQASVPPPPPLSSSHHVQNGTHPLPQPPVPSGAPPQPYQGQADPSGFAYGQTSPTYASTPPAPPSLSHSTSTPAHIHSRPLPEPNPSRNRRHSIVSSNPSQMGFNVRPPSQMGYANYGKIPPPPPFPANGSVPPPPPLRHSSSVDSGGMQPAYMQAGSQLPHVPPPPPLPHTTPPSQHPRAPSRQPSMNGYAPPILPQQMQQSMQPQVPPPPPSSLPQGYQYQPPYPASGGPYSVQPGPLPRPPQFVPPPSEAMQAYSGQNTSYQ